MKIVKYDRIRGSIYGYNTTINNNSETTNIESSPRYSNRVIWGQSDTGDDINGSMSVSGTVNIKAIVPPTYDPDIEDVDGEDVDEESGGGMLNVENSITSNDVYAKQHLYINYPHPNGDKQCVVDLIKSNEDKINRNIADIAELKKGGTGGTIDETAIMAILNKWKYGAYDRPVVLASGILRKSAVASSTEWIWEGIKLDTIETITPTWSGGQMTLSFQNKPYTNNWIYSVNVTQYIAGDTDQTPTTIIGRGDGSHWFEAKWDNYGKKIYIREFHQGNKDNDTWLTEYWGGDGGGIKAVSITIVGYVDILSTTAENETNSNDME